MHLPFLLPVIICILIKFEWSPSTNTLLSINNPFLGSRFISSNTNSHFQLQQVWHHPRSTLVVKEFNDKIIFIVWIMCSWMHSMIDSYFSVVSSKVFRFSSFAVTFWIVGPTVTNTCARLIFMPHYTAIFMDCFFIVRINHTLISSVLSSGCAVFYSLLSAHLFLHPHCISHTEHTLSIVSHPSCPTVTSARACTWQRT